jgi:hypothetical protein
MKTRSALLAAVLSASAIAPMPAQARERDLGAAADALSNPALQQGIAGAMAAMMQAMMGIKMGPMARAMEGMGKSMGDSDAGMDMDPDATLGDMMGPEGRDMPQELSAKVPAMMSGMAGMAGAMQQMLPQLEAMGKQLRKSIPRKFPRN